MAKAWLGLVALWAALVYCSAPEGNLVSQIDDADVDDILKPNMQDPVNVMERNIHGDLRNAESTVESAMPERLTSADAALDQMTNVAARASVQREAKIQAQLMKHRMPEAPELGEVGAETANQKHRRDEKIRQEVLDKIDPNMRESLRHAEPVSSFSYDGMRRMIHSAMESKMADLGESMHRRDRLGEGIEKIVTQKKNEESKRQHESKKAADVKSSVKEHLQKASAKLQQAQGNTPIELLQENVRDDPCDPPAPKPGAPVVETALPEGCKKPITVSDPTAGAAKGPVSEAQVTWPKNPYRASTAEHANHTMHRHRGNFSEAAVSAEMKSIHNQTLADEDKAEIQRKVDGNN